MKHPEKHIRRGTCVHVQLHDVARSRRVAYATGRMESDPTGGVLVWVKLAPALGAAIPIHATNMKLPYWG